MTAYLSVICIRTKARGASIVLNVVEKLIERANLTKGTVFIGQVVDVTRVAFKTLR